MCRVLGLSLVGTTTGCTSALGAGARRDAELKGRIVAIWIESGGIYGCPRITRRFLTEGERDLILARPGVR